MLSLFMTESALYLLNQFIITPLDIQLVMLLIKTKTNDILELSSFLPFLIVSIETHRSINWTKIESGILEFPHVLTSDISTFLLS